MKLSRLRTLRERKALSQRELAALAGLSHLTIVRLEGGNDAPYPRTVRKLAQALGVEPEALMEPEERS
jgi:HTH-type transcriptional regulator, competence development regulator